MSCPRIKLSNSQTLSLDDVETAIYLLNFSQQMRRINEDIPDLYFTLLYFTLLYFTLLDAAGISPTLTLNQNAMVKERGSWVAIKI